MARDSGYDGAVNEAAGRIRATVPENLVEKFAGRSGIKKENFIPCNITRCGEICAVDGSNVILLESGSMALALLRAAQTTFIEMERSRRSVTPLEFALIGPEDNNLDFPVLYTNCFGQPPGTTLSNEDRSKAAGVLRDTLEFWVTETMARELPEGALLLRDGPLRVSHASHDSVLGRILAACKGNGIGIAGISKRTAATWGGGHPLLPSVYALARSLSIGAPYWMKVDTGILDHAQFPQWQHGDMYIACLHPRAKSPLKIELPTGLSSDRAGEIMDRLASCSRDGRLPGYPYPLFDAHRTVVISEETAEKAKSDLIAGLARAGIDRQTYEILFGNYHDEFARY
ncbi:MAG: NurA domain protein [Methanoregula sp. PtaU1.Bin051]|nr:MAG: NurA domain protein [Methanoregula sp. PtaU1.Bin051]